MKSTVQTSDIDNQTGVPVDPFAVDFFGGGATGAGGDGDETAADDGRIVRARRHRGPEWYRTLPRLTNAEAGFSGSLAAFPATVSGAVADVFGSSLAKFIGAAEARAVLVSLAEETLAEARALRDENSVRIMLSAGGERAVAVLENSFARAIVRALLGATAEAFGAGPLSPVEISVLEFAAADVVNAVNALPGAGRTTLGGIGAAPAGDAFAPFTRGLGIAFELNAGELSGVVRIFASAGFARALGGAVFDRREPPAVEAAARLARGLRLYLQAGTTSLDAASLAYVEPGDIVLVERPASGVRTVGVGSGGGGLRLRGTLDDDGAFAVTEIISEEYRRKFTPARFAMEEFVTENADENAVDEEVGTDAPERLAPALENIQVALRVEIAGNRISLRELQELRTGQIIGLGCSPNDPVRLVTDASDEPVATGELVEIEGQLGVRLTKVFV